jgi:hypothetical protein
VNMLCVFPGDPSRVTHFIYHGADDLFSSLYRMLHCVGGCYMGIVCSRFAVSRLWALCSQLPNPTPPSRCARSPQQRRPPTSPPHYARPPPMPNDGVPAPSAQLRRCVPVPRASGCAVVWASTVSDAHVGLSCVVVSRLGCCLVVALLFLCENTSYTAVTAATAATAAATASAAAV